MYINMVSLLYILRELKAHAAKYCLGYRHTQLQGDVFKVNRHAYFILQHSFEIEQCIIKCIGCSVIKQCVPLGNWL